MVFLAGNHLLCHCWLSGETSVFPVDSDLDNSYHPHRDTVGKRWRLKVTPHCSRFLAAGNT